MTQIIPGYVSQETTDAVRKLQRLEVQWYRQYGKHANLRIRTNRAGDAYVVGDWAWHRNGCPAEFIERAMRSAVELAMGQEA